MGSDPKTMKEVLDFMNNITDLAVAAILECEHCRGPIINTDDAVDAHNATLEDFRAAYDKARSKFK